MKGASAGAVDGFLVVEKSGRDVSFFAIELGDVEGALDFTAGEFGDFGFGEFGLFGVWVTDEEVVKSELGTVEVGAVLVAAFGGIEEDFSNLVLGLGSVFGVGIITGEFLKCGDCSGCRLLVATFFLVEASEGELSPFCGGCAWGIVANLFEHFSGVLDADSGFDADEGFRDVSVGGVACDGFLSLDGVGVMA